MSTIDLVQIANPATPAASHAKLFYSSTLNPPGLAFIDAIGNVGRLYPPIVKLIADGGARTTATLTDETGLVFPVLANVYYRFSFQILFTSTAATSGLRFGVTTPTFTHFSAKGTAPITNTDGTTMYADALLSTSADSFNVPATAIATATDLMATIDGMILPSANGNVQVQTANQAAAGTVQIKQGSNGKLELLI